MQKARRMSPGVGLAAGLFGSIVGVGGGVLIVPMIVSACRSIPQRVVSGTSLAAVLGTAVASASAYAASDRVDLVSAALVASAAVLTAPLGARLASRLDCTTLRRTLGWFLLAVAPLVPLKAYLLLDREEKANKGGHPLRHDALVPGALEPTPAAHRLTLGTLRATWDKQWAAYGRDLGAAGAAAVVATGAAAGLASGLLGIGGGTIVTPVLALLMPYGQATVLGTSLLAMVAPSAAALLQHARLGNVDWRLAAGLAAGTVVGSAAGSMTALNAPPGMLELAFTVGMLFLGRKTLQTARPHACWNKS